MKNRICPVCHRSHTEPPAISRVDNKTDICPDCGMMEALAAIPLRGVEVSGNKWAIKNFRATHG